ncbi:hypothetical protein E0H82_05790 [Acinetobacter sp. ANC 4910]|uniref:hypothetical protein n=1 Tax=Acinetobacter sp. ANC 4910 TaxID=2529850 RepID=UPI00103B092F|nr:hypothetical protein [Acinetobacter sp. ANC 4910]TCB36281.1 hypothetical protein E0H82_05790 [Acinetobacter sp. ANC 4910]
MIHYSKTQLGHDALKQRSLPLNARQRRLLVLIGTEDFESMNEIFKQRLAPPELIEQLSEMGLIMASSIRSLAETETTDQIQTTSLQTLHTAQQNAFTHGLTQEPQQPIQSVITEPRPQAVRLSEEQIVQPNSPIEVEPKFEDLVALDFDDVKYLMAQLLQKYCGLMAKQLILRIQGSEDIRALKLCQMQWITQLQETRIPPKELNRILHQINFSLQRLNPA